MFKYIYLFFLLCLLEAHKGAPRRELAAPGAGLSVHFRFKVKRKRKMLFPSQCGVAGRWKLLDGCIFGTSWLRELFWGCHSLRVAFRLFSPPSSGSFVLGALFWKLRDCSVEGREIQSTSLKSRNLISCNFVNGFITVDYPDLILLRSLRPLGYIPRIQNTGHLVTATFVLDDLCLCIDCEWPHKEDQRDEFDDDGYLFF